MVLLSKKAPLSLRGCITSYYLAKVSNRTGFPFRIHEAHLNH